MAIAPKTWEEDGLTAIRGIARTGPGCHNNCGIISYVKEGKLVKIEGDPENPYNQGRLCMRCLAMKDVVNHPDRLKYPMKRAGKRGENKWQRISWDEAYDMIEEKWNDYKKDYGGESVVFLQGTGRDISPALWGLAYTYGSPNWTFGFLSGNACYIPRVSALMMMSGCFMQVVDCSQLLEKRYDDPRYKVPETIIIWGNNCVFSNSDDFLGHWIVELMKRGSKLIVVDPRVTWLAAKAEIWLQIRPGTDGALALAMMNVIIEEGLYDKEFVEKWCYGFEELAERVKEYPVSKVAEITRIPSEKIIKAARMFANSKQAGVQWGLKIDQTKMGIPTAHAIACLWTICGNLEKPGGMVTSPPRSQMYMRQPHQNIAELPAEVQAKRLGIQEYPMYNFGFTCTHNETMIRAMETGEPYPIKSAYIATNNPLSCTSPDPKRTYDALMKVEFNVVADIFMTPTAMAVADLVLPVATFSEREICVGYMVYNMGACYTEKVIEPLGEARSDWRITLDLGKRFNPEAWPYKDEKEIFRYALRVLDDEKWEEIKQKSWVMTPGFDYYKYEKGMLRADGQQGFETTTGRVELKMTLLEMWGQDPLPYYEEPDESPISTPVLAKEYPLILCTGARKPGFFHSEHRQIPKLRAQHPDPQVEINTETAAQLGIIDGEWVIVENQRGKAKLRAKLTPAIPADVVSADHGWWFPERDPEDLFGTFESNINCLTKNESGPTGFGSPYNALLCRVRKLERGE